MSTPYRVSYQLEIYSGVTCWRGEVNDHNARRLTDMLNENGHGYIELERTSLITWDGHLPRVVDTLGTVSVSKRNAIAVVCHDCPSTTDSNVAPERVSKVARRVALYSPPISIIGNLHAVRE